MSVTVNCPECQTSLDLPDEIPAGKPLRCPNCGAPFSVPEDAHLATGLQTAPSRLQLKVRAALLPPPQRSRRDDEDELNRRATDRARRRRRSGAVVLFLSVCVLLVLSLCSGAGGIATYVYRPPENPIPVLPQQPPPGPPFPHLPPPP